MHLLLFENTCMKTWFLFMASTCRVKPARRCLLCTSTYSPLPLLSYHKHKGQEAAPVGLIVLTHWGIVPVGNMGCNKANL